MSHQLWKSIVTDALPRLHGELDQIYRHTEENDVMLVWQTFLMAQRSMDRIRLALVGEPVANPAAQPAPLVCQKCGSEISEFPRVPEGVDPNECSYCKHCETPIRDRELYHGRRVWIDERGGIFCKTANDRNSILGHEPKLAAPPEPAPGHEVKQPEIKWLDEKDPLSICKKCLRKAKRAKIPVPCRSLCAPGEDKPK
jgi:hypothetical protein